MGRMMVDRTLQRLSLLAGIIATVYTLKLLHDQQTGGKTHARCNRTDGYCWTHDKAL